MPTSACAGTIRFELAIGDLLQAWASALLLVMRRCLVVGADALQLLIFHRLGSAGDFLLQPGEDAGLFDNDLVELFVLMLHVRESGFEFLKPGVNGRVHAAP